MGFNSGFKGLMTLSVCYTSLSRRFSNESTVNWSMYVFGICLEWLRETTENFRIGCVSAEVRMGKLQNTAPRNYRYNYLLGLISFPESCLYCWFRGPID